MIDNTLHIDERYGSTMQIYTNYLETVMILSTDIIAHRTDGRFYGTDGTTGGHCNRVSAKKSPITWHKKTVG